MHYADIDGHKQTAQPGQKGVCPSCRAPVIARCGTLVAWHWAHCAGDDCDTWSEPTGPWHLSWQDLVRPEFVEVVRGPHRADIVGNDDVVVELQHSSIDEEAIRDREAFYGSMVWVFDATERFRTVDIGSRCFFSFGRSKHITRCQKRIFLDFGRRLVEVEKLTNVFDGLHGFGYPRNRRWFMEQYLSKHLRADATSPPLTVIANAGSSLWENKCPYRLTDHASQWLSGAETRIVAKGIPYLPLDYSWKRQGESRPRPVWEDVILQFPGLANGWTEGEFLDMRQFLNATPMILDGRLRLMPSPDQGTFRPGATVRMAEEHLAKADEHAKNGRLPVLKPATKKLIRQRAQDVQERSTR